MRAIDAHIHWQPPAFREELAKHGPAREKVGLGTMFASATTPIEGALAHEDSTGHEVGVVCTAGVTAGTINKLSLAAARNAARIWNDEMAAAQRRYQGRVWGTGLVPLTDARAAIELMEEAVGLGLKGVNISNDVDGEAIESARLEDFYARAEELGCPLFMHPTDTDGLVRLLQGDGTDVGKAVMASLGRMVDSSVGALRLILGGVLERHPRLVIVHSHAGATLPYIAGRLDKNASMKSLPERPSAYLRRMYVDTVAPMSLSNRLAVDFYGVDHVLFGSDFPCWSAVEAFRSVDGVALGAADRARVLEGNARALLRLGNAAPPRVKETVATA